MRYVVTLPELAELASTTVKANNARDLRIAAETELSDVKRELLRAFKSIDSRPHSKMKRRAFFPLPLPLLN